MSSLNEGTKYVNIISRDGLRINLSQKHGTLATLGFFPQFDEFALSELIEIHTDFDYNLGKVLLSF